MGKTYFWKGVLLGALAGGALSLLDRQTRKVVVANCQDVTDKAKYIVKHPDEVINNVKESTERIRSTIENMSEEFSTILEKVDQLKEMTPQVTEIIKDTKEAFLEDPEEKKIH